jgi:hypothetical protein
MLYFRSTLERRRYLRGKALLFKEFGMSQVSLLAEFWDFLKYRKKWWLAPILIMLVLLSFLIIFTEGSALAPFIYAIF